MELKTYSQKSIQYAKYPRPGNNVAYPALGLISELYEFFNNPSVSEAGDCLWNLNALTYEAVNGQDLFSGGFVYRLRESSTKNSNRNIVSEFSKFLDKIADDKDYALKLFFLSQAFPIIGKLADISSKVVRKHDGQVQEDYRVKLVALLPEISDLIEMMAVNYQDITVEEVAEDNIEKLSGRAAAGTIVGNGDGISGEARKAG